MNNIIERFFNQIEFTDTCWLWRGYLKDGYGLFRTDNRMKPCHRVAFELMKNDIPDKHDVDHMCFVRNCVNPAHLRVLPASENRRLQRSSFKSHCINGHLYSPQNTYIRPEGARDCRACIRHRVAKYQERIMA